MSPIAIDGVRAGRGVKHGSGEGYELMDPRNIRASIRSVKDDATMWLTDGYTVAIQAEKLLDLLEQGGSVRGERRRRWTPEDIARICAPGSDAKALAREFGVSERAIYAQRSLQRQREQVAA